MSSSIPSNLPSLQNTCDPQVNSKPSLEQVYEWLYNKSFIDISTAAMPSIRGRIKMIGPYVSLEDGNALILIAGSNEFGIYVSDITSFKVEIPVVLQTEDELLLISGEEKYIINRKLLERKIPYFQKMKEFQEAKQSEIDLSLSISPNQLKLIREYFEGMKQIDPSLTQSDAVDLFMAADFLCIEELKIALLAQVPITQQVNSLLNEGLTELTLECRKVSFAAKSQPSLGIEGIIGMLQLADNLNVKIEKLSILNINDEELSVLVDYLNGNAHIKSLNISWSIRLVSEHLTDKCAPLFATLIQGLPVLKELKISDAGIGDKSLKSIAMALENNTTIEKVVLSCNQFSSEGFDGLTETLIRNQTLKSLNLTACGLGFELKSNGQYVKALSKNTSLQHLYLGNNGIYDAGASGLATVIKENEHLKTIDLWGNRITLEGREQLKEALVVNPALANIRVNSVSGEQTSTLILKGYLGNKDINL